MRYRDDIEALSEAKNYLLIFSADHPNPNVAPCAAEQIAAIDRAIARLKAAESERVAGMRRALEIAGNEVDNAFVSYDDLRFLIEQEIAEIEAGNVSAAAKEGA